MRARINALVDFLVEQRLTQTTNTQQRCLLQSIMGKVAVGNGKLAYQRYLDIFSSPRWQKLAAKGSRSQRLLWASTSTKNPTYRDVIYVEELIGKDTLDTIPPVTLQAFRDHGIVRPTLAEDIEAASQTMHRLAQVGISIREVTDRLLDDGLRLFTESFEKLPQGIGTRAPHALAGN
jgi:transaldolase